MEPSNARIEIGGKTYYADKKNGACVVKLDYGEYEYKVLATDSPNLPKPITTNCLLFAILYSPNLLKFFLLDT